MSLGNGRSDRQPDKTAVSIPNKTIACPHLYKGDFNGFSLKEINSGDGPTHQPAKVDIQLPVGVHIAYALVLENMLHGMDGLTDSNCSRFFQACSSLVKEHFHVFFVVWFRHDVGRFPLCIAFV